ncbi:hypothetical protein [Candidatus Palauibacter sp.]|uniref:hypothetical protein n=1 Tax=Candidatus Palauibacter sp. TaxID=3101350 RepID=UPI003C6EA4F7
MLTTKTALAPEYRKRSRSYHLKSVPHGQAAALLQAGWEHDKTLKTRTRFRKHKAHDERLEDMVWCLLHRLGYSELNEGRKLSIPIRRPGAQELSTQVDVLARDDETVIVVECESQGTLGRGSLQTDIGEFASLKGSIAAAVNHHYGGEPKAKIIWILATQNIVWSNPDLELAKGHSIHPVTERDLTYFRELASHLGHAARFQFLAEFLEGQKIPALADRSVPAIRGKLGGKKCYSFVTTPGDLLKIAFVNHRTRNDPDALLSYQPGSCVGG